MSKGNKLKQWITEWLSNDVIIIDNERQIRYEKALLDTYEHQNISSLKFWKEETQTYFQKWKQTLLDQGFEKDVTEKHFTETKGEECFAYVPGCSSAGKYAAFYTIVQELELRIYFALYGNGIMGYTDSCLKVICKSFHIPTKDILTKFLNTWSNFEYCNIDEYKFHKRYPKYFLPSSCITHKYVFN